ncbi:MAG: hypothetical protein ACTS5A_02335 [Candidatus Hodgkinia cicadicola]
MLRSNIARVYAKRSKLPRGGHLAETSFRKGLTSAFNLRPLLRGC